MSELRRISSHVDLSLDDRVRSVVDPRGVSGIDEQAHTEVVRTDIDLGAIDQLIDNAIKTYEPYDASVDRAVVIELHELLPLTRRQACDRRLWAWLGLVKYSHFVAHRWEPGDAQLRSPERFVGNRVRQTFARLWWAAELTVGPGGDYGLTSDLFALSGFQDVYEAIFGRAFCQYRPAMASFIKEVGISSEGTVRETAKEFGYLLTTLVLETLSEDDLRNTLSDLAVGVGEREVRRKGKGRG